MDIPHAAKVRAVELLNAELGGGGWTLPQHAEHPTVITLARVLAEHDRIARELSDNLVERGYREDGVLRSLASKLMLPEPEDPLAEAWKKLFPYTPGGDELLKAELDKAGVKIVPKDGA